MISDISPTYTVFALLKDGTEIRQSPRGYHVYWPVTGSRSGDHPFATLAIIEALTTVKVSPDVEYLSKWYARRGCYSGD